MTRPRATGRERYPASHLAVFAEKALCAVGVGLSDAHTAAKLITQSDLLGADAHGIFRLPEYVSRLRSGGINPDGRVTVERQAGAVALLNGDNALGHVVMSEAVRLGLALASSHGVAWIGTRQSNHAGPAGLYPRLVAQRDMIGLYGAVGSGNHIAPWGGCDALLGTNPISIAVPSSDVSPVVLDMATSVAAFGKVSAALQRGDSIPPGWMIDRSGNAITDPKDALDGTMMPAGDAKGYGLSLLIALLAGVLNGAAVGDDVVDVKVNEASPPNTGQFLCVIRLESFGDAQTIMSEVARFARVVRESTPLPGRTKIRLPGDEAHRRYLDRQAHGVPLDRSLVARLRSLADELAIVPLSGPRT